MNKNGRKASAFIRQEELLNNLDFNEKGLMITNNSIWLILDN